MLRAVRLIALAWVLVGIATLAALAIVIFRPALIVGVDGAALHDSVAAALGGSTTDDVACSETGDRWRCEIDTSKGSGNYTPYRVEVGNDGCWEAQGPRRGSSLDRRASGCVGLLDYIHILD